MVNQTGGKKKKTNPAKKTQTHKKNQDGGKKKKSQSGGKKQMNEYFTKMLKAKADGAPSFTYKGNTYVGKKHDKLGMVYKKK